MRDTAGEVGTNSLAKYSCGPLQTDDQWQDDQLEPIDNSSVPVQDVPSRERQAIENGNGKGSGRLVLAARHEDDDDIL